MKTLMFFIVSGLLFTSCVKEALLECPPSPNQYQYIATLYVEDKNYFNASALGLELVDEDLPFQSYVFNYNYMLEDMESGDVVSGSQLIEVDETVRALDLVVSDFPDGTYRLTVWGNVSDSSQVAEISVLHEDEAEDNDIYMVVDTFSLTAGSHIETSLGLERVKGELLVRLSNLPDYITCIDETITNVYENRDYKNYFGETSVKKTFMKEDGPLDQLITTLAPSVNNTSILHLSLCSEDMPLRSGARSDTPADTLTIDPIELDINRNEVTAITLDYDDVSGNFVLWVFLNDAWTRIKTLELREVTD